MKNSDMVPTAEERIIYFLLGLGVTSLLIRVLLGAANQGSFLGFYSTSYERFFWMCLGLAAVMILDLWRRQCNERR
jgi:uncharacterized membrane protein YuzA (DUF378 family)